MVSAVVPAAGDPVPSSLAIAETVNGPAYVPGVFAVTVHVNVWLVFVLYPNFE